MNIDTINQSVILLHAHLSDENRKQICHRAIEKFHEFGFDVIVATHTPVDKDTQELADYVIYDKDNIVQDNPEYKGFMSLHTESFVVYSKEFFRNNYTYAVHRLLTAGIFYAKLIEKKIIHIFDYDCLITDLSEIEDNTNILLNDNKKAITYEWVPEQMSGDYVNVNRQIVTMFLSAKVDELFGRFSNFLSLKHFEEANMKYSAKTTEEYLAYVMGITHHNKIDGSTWGDVVVKNFYDIRDRDGYNFAMVHTDAEMPWVCLCEHGEVYVIFYKSNNSSLEKYKVVIDGNTVIDENMFPEVYMNYYAIRDIKNVEIFINDKLFRTYDLSDDKTIEYIRKCNRWVVK